MTRIAFASLVGLLIAALPLAGAVDEADRLFAERADGARGGRAAAAPIDGAIAAYRRALQSDPSDLETRWKLLRALRFKGSYAATSAEEKKEIFAEAKRIGDEGVERIEQMLVKRGLASPGKADETRVAAAVAAVPHAAAVYYWDAVAWGEWALVTGKISAARQGAADRIRRVATISMLADRSFDGGGATRLLGRLHDQTPRIPFVTGWASSDLAVKYLREAAAIDASSKLTRLFLAEALANQSKKNRQEAVAILRDVVTSPNDPEWLVEEAAAQEEAERLLQAWGVSEK